jgi:hypothetical protein
MPSMTHKLLSGLATIAIENRSALKLKFDAILRDSANTKISKLNFL